MNLMIVDDNVNVRKMIRSLFADMFDAVTECGSGEEAVEVFEKINPDWVLMDIKMKKMNGIAATKQIIRNHPGAKIIIVTQYDDSEIKNIAINAGAMNYYSKTDISIVREFIQDKSNSFLTNYGANQ